MNHYFINNNDIRSEKRIIKYTYGSSCFEFISDNGVFAKNKIDYGSKLLVQEIVGAKPKAKSFLDVGCGYGFISISLAKILNIEGVGVDINKRAVNLAFENAKLNKVNVIFRESNIYDNVHEKYDLIVTNPPIRAGKKVVLEILKRAQDFLNPEGEVWFVIRKDQGAKSIFLTLKEFYQIEIREKSKGFYIFVAKTN